MLAIARGLLAGYFLCRAPQSADATGAEMPLRFPISRRAGVGCLVAFVLLLVGAPLAAAATGWGALSPFDAFYRSGTLVFGGGHVVLRLLQAAVVETGWVSEQDFLAGYGAAQSVPGPLFTFAAYLGTITTVGLGSVLGAAIALDE